MDPLTQAVKEMREHDSLNVDDFEGKEELRDRAQTWALIAIAEKLHYIEEALDDG